MMYPKTLSASQNRTLQQGLRLVIIDGLATEAMSCLTSGSFLVAIALYLGASNLQVGILATLPVFCNIFQLVALWAVETFPSRRKIVVVCSTIARLPLLAIAALPVFMSGSTVLPVLMLLLFVHCSFGAVSGAAWNAWMKDLVPAGILGNFFAHRIRLTEIFNVSLSLCLAFLLDYIRSAYHGHEIIAYSIMFVIAGASGIAGVYALSKTPEPMRSHTRTALKKQMVRPVKDKNFRRLLAFSGSWSFAISLFTPFVSVFMLKSLHLSLTMVIVMNIVAQFGGILAIKSFGRYADQFSNKTILALCIQLYAAIMVGWIFVRQSGGVYSQIMLVALLQFLAGTATSGINLSLSNIGLKLSAADVPTAYLTAKNMTAALFSAFGPIAGGWCIDVFASQHAGGLPGLPLLRSWQPLEFLFCAAAAASLLSLYWLKKVKEEGEVSRKTLLVKIGKHCQPARVARKFRRRPAPVKLSSIGKTIGKVFVYELPKRA